MRSAPKSEPLVDIPRSVLLGLPFPGRDDCEEDAVDARWRDLQGGGSLGKDIEAGDAREDCGVVPESFPGVTLHSFLFLRSPTMLPPVRVLSQKFLFSGNSPKGSFGRAVVFFAGLVTLLGSARFLLPGRKTW